MNKRLVQRILIGVLLAHLGVIVYYWWRHFGVTVGISNGAIMLGIGRLVGFLAASAVLLQLMLMGRIKWIEPYFGHDHLVRAHRLNGQAVLTLILLHPTLITLGNASLVGQGIVQQSLDQINHYPYVWMAEVAVALFVTIIAVTIYMEVTKKLRYEVWYTIHLGMYIAIALLIWHQFANGTTLSDPTFRVYWKAVYIFVFANFLYFRWLRIFVRYGRHRFWVMRVTPEGSRANSVEVGGVRMDKFTWQPGQFIFVRFLTHGRWWQAHPFTISKVYDGKSLRLTIRALGDFTNGIVDLPKNTRVLIDGPHGIYGSQATPTDKKILLIAGGIGITPLRALAERFGQEGRDIVLLYSNRTTDDIALRDEIENLAAKYDIKVYHIISDQPDYSGEKGMLDQDKLQRLVPDITSRLVFLCGPPPMMNAVGGLLRQQGVARHRIITERFSLH